MTEILTESFCERCGTRYTFESARPRVRLKGVKVLSRGLKNFVMSDDSSIDEAMAAARSDTDRELTAHQLDAFHKTFNFCMSCRQYTCPNCWNESEARCLSCAPRLGEEVMPAPFPDLVTSSYHAADPVDTAVTNGSNGHDAVADDAPASGVDVAHFAARLQALMGPPAEAPAETVAETVVAAKLVDEVIEDAPVAAPIDEGVAVDPGPAAAGPLAEIDEPVAAEPIAAVEAAPIEPGPASVEPVVADTAILGAEEAVESDESSEAAEIAARLAAWGAAAAAFDAAGEDSGGRADPGQVGGAQSGGLLRRFRAGQSLDAELEAYEQEQTSPAAGDVDAETVAGEAVVAAATGEQPEVDAEAAETFQPEPEAVAPFEPTVEPEVEAVGAVEPAVEPEPDAEAVAAVEPEVEDEPEAVAAIEPEPVAAIEPEAAVNVEPEPEPVAAEPIAEPTAEPVPTSAPEPVAAEPDPTRAPEPVDVVEQPTWRMVAPDPTIEVPATPPISPSIAAAATAPDPNAEPQWPTRASSAPSVGLPFLNRPPAATGGLEALWAESARDVVAPPTVAGRPVVTGGVQPCVSCGLSLSATARFCRRCGTPQAV